jgi:hypothetical protein
MPTVANRYGSAEAGGSRGATATMAVRDAALHCTRPEPLFPFIPSCTASHFGCAKAKSQLKSAPDSCGNADATDDIFFLEVCLFNQICSNGHELFRLQIGQHWQCHFDEERFDELKRILVEPPKGRTRNPFYPIAPIEGENAVGR